MLRDLVGRTCLSFQIIDCCKNISNIVLSHDFANIVRADNSDTLIAYKMKLQGENFALYYCQFYGN